MAVAATFGELLNHHLQRADRSASWLALRVGVSPSAVSRWLADESRPRQPEIVGQIVQALGVRTTEERNALFAAAGFAYVESPTLAIEPGEEAEIIAASQPLLVVERTRTPPSLLAQAVDWVRTQLHWDEAPAHARLSWAGMTVYLLDRLRRRISYDQVLIVLIAVALWLPAVWLLMPILSWPVPSLAERQRACLLFTLACVILPPLVAFVTHPDGFDEYAPQSWNDRITLSFLKLTGAFVGFGGFAGLSWGVVFLWVHLIGRAAPRPLCWLLAAVPLLFAHIGARRIPLDRYRMYGELKPHPADLWFLPVYVCFGPLLALFLYVAHSHLADPWVGYGALLCLIVLIWWERRSTQRRPAA
jgi:transcriptional regulator with XRE-family HTH domain